MEAMAIGLPVVASNIRGNVDLIEEGINGYLCNPKDANSFAQKLEIMASDYEMRKRMSETNKKKIRNYDISVVEEEIRSIYKEVLS